MKKTVSLRDKAGLALALSVVNFQAAHAQDVDKLITTISSTSKTVGKNIVGVVQVVIIIVAVVMLIMIVIESLKPQSQSRDGLVRLFAITIVALAAISVFKMLIGG